MLMFCERENMFKERVILRVGQALCSWRSRQNRTLRSTLETASWEVENMCRGFDYVCCRTFATLTAPANPTYMGVDVGLLSCSVSDEGSDLIFQDDQAKLISTYAFGIVSSRVKRLLPISRGWPRLAAEFLSGDPDVRKQTMLELRRD